MLRGGDQHALAHQAGGIGDFGDITAGCGDFKVIEVGSAEYHAGARGRRQQPHRHRSPAVEADAGKAERRGKGLLEMAAMRRWELGQR